MILVPVQLPADLFCQHCVFQWKYTTGNNWGRDPETNKSGPGLGRENETFMGCADITIVQTRPLTSPPPPRRVFPSKTCVFPSHSFWRLSHPFRRSTRRKSTRTTTVLPFLYIPLSFFTNLKIYFPTTTTTTITTTTTTTTTSSTTIALTTIPTTQRLRVWSALLVSYERGDEVIFDGFRYRCVTSHRSYAGAEPSPLTWVLWRKIT